MLRNLTVFSVFSLVILMIFPAYAAVESINFEKSFYTDEENFTFVGIADGGSSVFVIIHGPGGGFAGMASDPVIDGDGSVLTNLGTLPTIANNVADNYILMIIDNGSYGSTGDQPTYTGRKTSLAEMARGAGCENVVEVVDKDTGPALETALASGKMTVMVVKCDSGNAKMPVITMDPVIIRHRFMEAVKA